jgi:phosphoglycolate phosphatase-like HAD superfamily hydrolase
MMQLILFDLDGTLLTSQGMGRESTRTALETVFGTSGNLDAFYPGGRTQEAIFLDTLLDAGFSQGEYFAKRSQLYRIFLKEFAGRVQKDPSRIKPLPGAIELIETLNTMADYQLGIVTGNHRKNASLKLQSAGFNPDWFSVGAYGEESVDRSDLVLLAVDRAQNIAELERSTVVVGDTTRDVESARNAGAISIAVSSGTDRPELLKSSSPDYLLEGLHDPQTFLDILVKVSF